MEVMLAGTIGAVVGTTGAGTVVVTTAGAAAGAPAPAIATAFAFAIATAWADTVEMEAARATRNVEASIMVILLNE